MKLNIEHTTTYDYSDTVSFSRNELRLKPKNNSHQTLGSFNLELEPEAKIRFETDYYGNEFQICKVNTNHRRLSIKASSSIITEPKLVDSTTNFEDLTIENPLLEEFLLPTNFVPLDRSWVEEFNLGTPPPDAGILEYLVDSMGQIHELFNYNQESTNVNTKLDEFARHKCGVCQDFAHSFLAVCREQGIPSRYVSGYIRTGKGSSASHAWVEVFLPDAGWVGMDPTNNQFTGEQYVMLAVGRDYEDCAPVSGLLKGGGTSSMSVEVNVERDQSDISSAVKNSQLAE